MPSLFPALVGARLRKGPWGTRDGQTGRSYQFGGAASGEDPARALEVQMSGAPAAHVEPLHRPGGARPVLLVQQHQLLQGPHRRVLQHLLQLGDEEGRGGIRTDKE